MRYLKYALIVFLFASCASKKGVVYFQDIDGSTLEKVDSVYANPVIQVNDIIRIRLSALDDNSLNPFRFSSSDEATSGALGYTVRPNGTIRFPIFGDLKVDGITVEALQNTLQDSLSIYVNDPIVQAKIMNFKFTVLGSVNNPGTYTIEDESINLLQALGLAGDVSITGKRENILIVRQVNGERTTARLDLTKSGWLNSEFYYIKQNDVLYVEPNFAEVKTAGFISSFTELLRVVTVATTTYLLFTR